MSFFLLTLPRSGGTALARMMGASAEECAGSLLEAARRLPPGSAAALLGGRGLRATFYGHRSWEDAVTAWSWLLETFPDSRLVFLTRAETDDYELSLEFTGRRWIPAYGSCPGRVLMNTRVHREAMEDFHLMNPGRTILLDHADLANHAVLAAKLGELAPNPARWEAVMAERPNLRGRQIEKSPGWTRPPEEDRKLWQDLDGEEDPFAGAESLEADLAALEAESDGEADPFSRRKPVGLPADYQPGVPRPFIESAAEHPRAIVYPWLASAAVWDELRYSLRSVERHFTDKECPIYILGDAPPPWLKPGGRVRWRAIQGYARSRPEGMWQATVTGVQLAEEVCWMNDDIYFLRDTGWDDLRVALTEGRIEHRAGDLMMSGNVWQRGLGRAVGDLRTSRPAETVWRFATHTPFLFERWRSLEILQTYKLAYKGSWVTLYHNHHRTPHRPAAGLKARHLPAPAGARYLNHGHRGPHPETAQALAERFPTRAAWELPDQPSSVPRIIHQTWKTAEIPHEVYPREWQESWQVLHPQWEYRLWTDADLLALAEEHYPEFEALFRAARGVIKADVGRLLILHHHGGLYADLDYMALKPMDALVRGGSGLFVCTMDSYTHNALLAAAPGQALLLAAAREALSRWREAPGAAPEWISGPDLLASFTYQRQVSHWTGAQVCPLDWRKQQHEGDWRELLENCGEAHAVTFWRHNW